MDVVLVVRSPPRRLPPPRSRVGRRHANRPTTAAAVPAGGRAGDLL